MKKCMALVLAIMMLLAMVGCSTNKATTETPNINASTTPEKVENVENDPFPGEKNITWYVLAAGSPSDTIARVLAPYLEKELGQTIVVENKGGAGGINMLTPVLTAEPDGYSWAAMAPAQACLTVHQEGCPFNYDSFAPIANVVSQPQVLFVAADAPYDTFEEWKTWVEENPGQFNYYTIGASSQVNVTAQALAKELGLSINHVPYASDAEGIAAVMGGHIQGGVTGYSTVSSALDDGSIKLIAYTTETKNENYMEIKSLAELGLETNSTAFQGVVTSKGIPENRLNKIVDAFETVLSNPEVIDNLKEVDLYYEGTTLYGEDFEQMLVDSYMSIEGMLNDTGLMQELFG